MIKDKERRKEVHQRWVQEHQEQQKEYKRKYYLEHRERNKLRNREYSVRYHHRQKIEVLSHYSNSDIPCCLVCGEGRIACLSIDHIHGGGYQHRKSLMGNFYSWLKRQEYPEGYQTLCMNCQAIKRVELKEHRRPEF